VRASSSKSCSFTHSARYSNDALRRFPQRAPQDCHRPRHCVMCSRVTDAVSPHHHRRPPLADHTSGGKRCALRLISTTTSFRPRDPMFGFGTWFHPLREIAVNEPRAEVQTPSICKRHPPEWQGGGCMTWVHSTNGVEWLTRWRSQMKRTNP